MRNSTSIALIGISLLGIIGTTASALPSAPPAGGYTGGLFSRYFQNIVETAPNGGSCPVGQSLVGFTTTKDSTYGTPICSTITSPQYWSSTDSGANIYFTGAGNVAIGKAVGTAKLDVSGDILVNGVTVGRGSGSLWNVAVGQGALGNNTTGNQNVAVGELSLTANTTGYANTAVGYVSLYPNTTGYANTANGFATLYYNTTGYNNTAIGQRSLYSNTTGFSNSANGVSTLESNTTGNNNVANGWNALRANTTGSSNTANGVHALSSNISGYQNTANGYFSLFSNNNGYGNVANGMMGLMANTNGYYNTANGYTSLSSNTNGYGNVANGAFALRYNQTIYNTANGYAALTDTTTGNENTANGAYALFVNTTGYQNTADGVNALQNNNTGSLNTGIGYNAGSNLTSGNNNIAIGASSNFPSTTGSNQLNIGNWIYGTSGNIGIGTGTALTAKLTVAGQVQITGGVPGAGKVLTSDAAGLASWATPSAGAIAGGQTNYIARWLTATTLGTGSVFDNGTNVGIGTTTPAAKFDIDGRFRFSYNSPTYGVGITAAGPGGGGWARRYGFTSQAGTTLLGGFGAYGSDDGLSSWWIGNDYNDYAVSFDRASKNAYFVGNVGIGTTTPAAKLAVNAIGVIGGANQGAYDIGAGRIAVGQSLYSYGRICAGAASGDCTGGGGFMVDTAGTLTTAGVVTVGTTSSNLFMNDTDESTTGPKRIHANSNLMGFLNGAGSWMSYWDNAGNQSTPGTITVQGGIADSAGTRMDSGGGWIRTYGNSGWYNGTYAGGMYMVDSTWIRTYAGKYFYVDSIIQAGAYMNSPAYYYISDARLKKDLKKIDSPLAKIEQMNGYYFSWKKDNKKDIGLIAQEVEKIFPDAVGEYTDPDSKEKYKNVEYGHLIAPVIEAIKELAGNVKSNTADIDALKAENAELKKRLDAIEARLAK